jgi:hypothetical protein
MMAHHLGKRDLDIAALFPGLVLNRALFNTATKILIARDIFEEMGDTIQKLVNDDNGLEVEFCADLPDGYVTGMCKYPEGLGEWELVYLECTPKE